MSKPSSNEKDSNAEDSNAEDSNAETRIPQYTPSRIITKRHPQNQVIGNMDIGILTRRRAKTTKQAQIAEHCCLMDVKTAFLNGYLGEEVYMEQPEGNDILVIEVYVDDIIFGCNNDSLSKKFSKIMESEFEMSMLDELTFFLGLQVMQLKQGIFLSQTKYAKEMLKKFNMTDCKPVTTPMETGCKLSMSDDSPEGTLEYGVWYPRTNDFTLVGITDSDWVGCIDDHKSTSGAAFFLGDCLVAWHNKKQDCVTLSTVESEYIAATACCT
ncbi:uncharacterized mitochondrial protein AtMg00810-like [Cryptomeria japonica]|uniref:uncharacterized mitochondrial protein AtMg00810-like n=1 Tax=Cryptomeria japonica TaxID=3369 RepID=UPI0027D9F785|nr:uncharacterized mitochondrial protein AtMg00810-like [Cryptomeria japonica]